MADVLCDEDPVAVTTALREQLSSLSTGNGITLTASGLEDDLSRKKQFVCYFLPINNQITKTDNFMTSIHEIISIHVYRT